MKFQPLQKLAFYMIAGLLALITHPALAQYPNKPIRFVIWAPAGGTADAAARVIATSMSQTLGQPVVVDNKPGADGIIAADLVAKAPPDGYTITMANAGSLGYAPATRKTLPYDPIADFTFIGQMGEFGYFVYVHPSLPIRDLKEFASHLKANPGKLNHGQGSATGTILSSAFARANKLDFLQVPYKGEAPLTPDLLSGRVELVFGSGGLLPHAKEGRLRAIATTLPARSPLAPDVPTFTESGFAQPGLKSWIGLAGPARMPPEIVERLSRALTAALGQPEVRERFTVMAGQITPSTADQFTALVKDQLVVWRREAMAAGIQAE